ncbi:hypothetical protein [Paracraurococcus lichenis]|uniref:Uncharacterized protein n=1 Tax=Paracraurococcus lichenis TaxID=3064888 RepID=A0ABT9E638_9PROT|nr:hypothetical protein [Paracraurococcus sp. LOR1-02]MDO9711601.1 hypothetical protein [Paracraurococcus sp. LOR1-02]
MPMRFTGRLAILEGTCAAEEAEPLAAWLRETTSPGLDLSGCDHMHTAVLQALLAFRPRIAAAPADPFWAQLGLQAEATPEDGEIPASLLSATALPTEVLPEAPMAEPAPAAAEATRNSVAEAPEASAPGAGPAASAELRRRVQSRRRRPLQDPSPIHLGPADRRLVEEDTHA